MRATEAMQRQRERAAQSGHGEYKVVLEVCKNSAWQKYRLGVESNQKPGWECYKGEEYGLNRRTEYFESLFEKAEESVPTSTSTGHRNE